MGTMVDVGQTFRMAGAYLCENGRGPRKRAAHDREERIDFARWCCLPGSRRRAAVESIPPIHPYRSCLDATKIRTITAEVPVRRITSHNAISGSRR